MYRFRTRVPVGICTCILGTKDSVLEYRWDLHLYPRYQIPYSSTCGIRTCILGTKDSVLEYRWGFASVPRYQIPYLNTGGICTCTPRYQRFRTRILVGFALVPRYQRFRTRILVGFALVPRYRVRTRIIPVGFARVLLVTLISGPESGARPSQHGVT